MNVQRLHARVGACASPVGAVLDGYTLTFNKQARNKPGIGYANIMPAAAADLAAAAYYRGTVHGVLYELTDAQFARLDEFEGVAAGQYCRQTVRVTVNGEQMVDAVTYRACAGAIGDGLLPETEYLQHLLAGQAYLPAEYLAQLKQQPVWETAHR